MSNTPIQVSYSLEQVLTRIEGSMDDFRHEITQKFQETNQKLDDLQKDVTDLKVGQARLEADVSTLKEDVRELKTSNKTVVGDVADF